MSQYEDVLVEIYYDDNRNKKRARPCPNQKYPTNMKVECPRQMKSNEVKLGTVFKIRAKIKEPKNFLDEKHLYTSYKWPFEFVSTP